MRPRGLGLSLCGRLLAALLGVLLTAGLCAGAAFANAPNPTSVHVDSVSSHGSEVTVTVSGTWTWDVPNGAQKDCNDSRIGVGYAVSWGDNTANALKPAHGGEEIIYVGDASDDWVHAVTEGSETVDGPFTKEPGAGGGFEETLVAESMLGDTPEGTLYGFGPQGISTGATTAVPTEEDARHWFSNCGPTTQSEVDGQRIGNSDPSEPEQGYPSGTWGPISHTYKTAGSDKICPVLYDPHGHEVGEPAQDVKEITAGGSNHNNDNSVESNGNISECTVAITFKSEPEFTIEKLQSLPGTGFTKNELTGKVGETVRYEIDVDNTGNETLTFGALADPACTNIQPSGSTEVAAGHSETFTCEHELTSPGTWVNEATIRTGEKEKTSNLVVVKVPAEAFVLEKEQKLATQSEYTKSRLTTLVGETVDYKITVTNTGEAPELFSGFSDPNCTNIAGGPQGPLAPGAKASWTCEHKLTTAGEWTNVATVSANERPPTKSNEVVVIAQTQAYVIVKEQKLAGQPNYTKESLTAKIGETVDYRITVENTGEEPETFDAFSDPNCTNINGGPTGPLAHGEKASWTCEHVLTAGGAYENVATVQGNKEPGTSNKVVVNVAKQEVKGGCAISEPLIVLRGATGSKRKAFTVRISSLGIKEITFYLDGHKLKTLTAAQARHGEFAVDINATKLSYGPHKVSVRTVMSDTACPNIARASVFVHPKPPAVTPKFTG